MNKSKQMTIIKNLLKNGRCTLRSVILVCLNFKIILMGILGGTYNTIISDLTKIKTFQQKRDHSTKVIRINLENSIFL